MTTPSAATIAVVLAFLAVGPLVAQDAPSSESFEATVRQLREKVRFRASKEPTEEEAAALAAGEHELSRFVESVERQQGLTERQYVLAADTFVTLYPAEALRLAHAGLRHFPESLRLLFGSATANIGVAETSFPSAARVRALEGAERSLRTMAKLGADTWPVHAAMARVLAHLDRCTEALAEFDAASRDPRGEESLRGRTRTKVSLLLRAGQPLKAIEAMRDTPEIATIDRLVLTVRARALAKDLAATRAAIVTLRDAENSPRTTAEAADALGHLGERAEALRLLASRPATPATADRDALEWSRTCAALEVLLRCDDLGPASPLRMALTNALDHHFWMGRDENRFDFRASPLVMMKMIGGMGRPEAPITVQGDHLLFLLCAAAAPTHRPDDRERVLLDVFAQDGQPMPSGDDVPAHLLAMRENVGDPDAGCPLTALRIAEQIAPKPVAPSQK